MNWLREARQAVVQIGGKVVPQRVLNLVCRRHAAFQALLAPAVPTRHIVWGGMRGRTTKSVGFQAAQTVLYVVWAA
jgi:hypothetical protein